MLHWPFRHPAGRWTAALLAGTLLLASCASFRSAPVSSGAGAQVPPPATQSTFTVTRGSITDIIQSSGRVVATQQQVLYFRQSGHLNSLAVHLNDKVKAGQVLAALDTSGVQTQIQQAQAAVDAANLALEKTKELQLTQGNSSTSNGKVITTQDVASADAAITSAQAAYDGAQANLAAVETPNAQAVQQAQAAVVQAQAAVGKAQLRLQTLTAGPSASDQAQAQAGVQSAKAKLDAVQQQLKVVQAGPTAVQLAQARAALEQSQAQFQSALAAYDAFQNGPSDAQRQQAALAVTQATNALFSAQTKRDSVCNNVGSKSVSQADCNVADAAVKGAQSTLDAAQKAVSQLGNVSPTDRLAAESAYKQAEDKFTAAQQTYQEMLQGALPASAGGGSSSGGHISHATQVAQAQGAVQQAQAGVIAAQATLTGLTPTANEVAQARQAVSSAQAGLQSAQAQLGGLLNPPDTTVRQAKDQVAQAAAAITAAQARAQQLRDLVGQTDTNALDLAIKEAAVKQAQLGVEALQDQLSQMQIVAPFDGTVIASNGQAGNQIGAYAAVLTIANPETLQVAVDLSPDQMSRVAIGQQVNLTLREFPGQNISGAVTGLPTAVLAASNQNQNSPGAAAAAQTAGGSAGSSAPAVDPAAVTITPKWPGSGANIGEVAKISISAETRSDVLLVPTQAINKTNNRTFVLVEKNGHELPVDVHIGIQNADLTEVQSGLEAGQKVFQRAG